MPVKIISSTCNKDGFLSSNEGEMTRREFRSAEKSFSSQFKYYDPLDNDLDLLQEDRAYFEFKDFEDLVNSEVPPNPNYEPLVVVYYGMIEDKIIYGFRIVAGEETEIGSKEYTYTTEKHPSHYLKNFKFIKITSSNPDLFWSEYSDLYFRNVKINRKDQTPSNFEDLKRPINDQEKQADPYRIVFPWNLELKKMYHQSSHTTQAECRMVIESISRQHHGPNHPDGDGGLEGYRHGIAFFAQKKVEEEIYVDLLDDQEGHSTSVYTNKAADYGNLCPPKCEKYSYPS